jgi:hypothetical protein
VSNDRFYNAIKDMAEKQAEAGWGDSSFNDSCFIIEKGAEKNPNPTTEHQFLQKYRKLPHHTKNATDGLSNSTVDIPHLRNALARVSQISTIKEDKAGFISRATAHLQRHAKALLKTYKTSKSTAQIAELEAICKEFNIDLEEEIIIDQAEAVSIKIVKNGSLFCVKSTNRNFGCYKTQPEAQKRMDQVNKFGKK